MMVDDGVILEVKEKLSEYGIVLSFRGPFSQEIIEEIGSALKSYLKNKDKTKGEIYNVFSIFIEQTQNVKNYAFDFKDGKKKKILDSGIIIIGEKDGKYFICSGNLVQERDMSELKERLNNLQESNDRDLKKLYKERLRADMSRDSKGGAGLGLIEMARKASEKIDYEFIAREDDYYFYTLTVII
ncbi:MAG: SiaB family protein kinase [Halanaerobacter sp.]